MWNNPIIEIVNVKMDLNGTHPPVMDLVVGAQEIASLLVNLNLMDTVYAIQAIIRIFQASV